MHEDTFRKVPHDPKDWPPGTEVRDFDRQAGHGKTVRVREVVVPGWLAQPGAPPVTKICWVRLDLPFEQSPIVHKDVPYAANGRRYHDLMTRARAQVEAHFCDHYGLP